jgi:hypothetical protein
MRLKIMAAAAAALFAGSGAAQADSISEVEGARAKDRAGYHLSRQDREKLRRHGRSDDYGYSTGYGYDGYYEGPPAGGVSVYVGPRYDHSYGY